MKPTFKRIALTAAMLSLVFGSVLVLSACSESSQSLSNKVGPHATKPWDGAKDPFVAKGWTVGNEDSWRAQMRHRAQNQNEYVRIN